MLPTINSRSTMDPTLQNKIRHMVEVEGMSPDELLNKLHEDAERQLIEQADEEERIRRGIPRNADLTELDTVPNEIQLIAQALAYRSATVDDLDDLHKLLNLAYKEEVIGDEAFRIGEAVTKDSIEYHLLDPSYQWLLIEAPNGHGMLKDGDILGACCYSTDGVSRKNGIVEGNVGSIRYFGILPRFRGLCVGRRFLQKVEEQIFKVNCILVAVSVPSPRQSMMKWISDRNYDEVRAMLYPFGGLRHSPFPTLNPEEIYLVQFVKSNSNFKKDDSLSKPLNSSTQLLVDNNDSQSLQPPQPPSQPKKKIPLPPHWRQSEMIISDEIISSQLEGLEMNNNNHIDIE